MKVAAAVNHHLDRTAVLQDIEPAGAIAEVVVNLIALALGQVQNEEEVTESQGHRPSEGDEDLRAT